MRVDPFQSRRSTLTLPSSTRQWFPVVVDPAVPFGTIEVRGGNIVVAKIENVGFGDATAVQIGEQELGQR